MIKRISTLFFTLSLVASSMSLGLFWINGGSARLMGRVVDEENRPVPEASVIVPELSQAVKTDKNGIFSVVLPLNSAVHIEIFKDGFSNYASKKIFIGKRSKVPTTFVLVKNLSEEITVTATATKMKFEDVPVKTYLISHKKIEEMKPVNLAEALSFTTGVRVEVDCQNCNYTQVRLNGLEGKYSQILIDGLPVISSLASVYGLEQIPSEMIEKIEVVKGGASSIYGSNAIGGVVNLITREPEKNRTILKVQEETMMGKPFFKIGLTSSFVSKDKNTKAFAFGSYFHREPVDVNGDGFSNLGILRDTSFGANVYRNFPSMNGKLKFSFARIHEYRRGGDSLDVPPHEAMIAEMIRTNRLDFNLTWEQSFGSDLLRLSFSQTFHQRNSYYGAGKDPNAYGNTYDPLTIGLAQYTFSLGPNLFTIGGSYNREHLKDEAPDYGRMIDDEYINYGVFLQDDLSLGKEVDFLFGSRFDRHSKVGRIIASPRASLLLKPFKGLGLRATLSTGFRAPQVFDEDLHITMIGGEGFVVKNSPALKEEKSYSLYIGGDYMKSKNGRAFLMSSGFFYTRLKNQFQLQDVGSTGNSRIFLRTNGEGAKVYGGEFDIGIRVGRRLEFDSGLTLEKTLLDEPEPEFGSRELFKTPRIYGYIRVSATFPFKIKGNLSYKYTGKMKLPHYHGYILEDRLETTEPYSVFNINISRVINIGNEEVEIYGGVYNIFNSFQKDIDRGPLRDAGYIYGPSKPRAFMLGIKYEM